MIIDCERCQVRDIACGDCVIGVLLGAPAPAAAANGGTHAPSGASKVQLDAPERHALDVLAAQGLVPRLRLVALPPRRATDHADSPEGVRDAG
ncbi:hypothetical protein [Pseudonocardia sp. GCM10023141]|uniref:hypothetical protein n=1 Tax=Pseudonocardia sp. GCM10023141 TaxID=3252653 RepID=UPI00361926E9